MYLKFNAQISKEMILTRFLNLENVRSIVAKSMLVMDVGDEMC